MSENLFPTTIAGFTEYIKIAYVINLNNRQPCLFSKAGSITAGLTYFCFADQTAYVSV
jgi:hypothetical protein